MLLLSCLSLRQAIIEVSKESFTLKTFDFKLMKTYTTGFFPKKNFQSDTGSLPSWSQFSMRIHSAPRPYAPGVIFLMVFWSGLRSICVQRSARNSKRRWRGAAPFKTNILILISFWYHVTLLTQRTQKGLFHWRVNVSHRDIYTIMLVTSWPVPQPIPWWSCHGNDRLSCHMMC